MSKKTKIVATLGPASRDVSTIEAMIRAGMDVARINFSHGTQSEHLETIRSVRAAAERVGRPVALLGDLCGPKIRTGSKPLSDHVLLEQDSEVLLTSGDIVGPARVGISHPEVLAELQPDETVFLRDGMIELTVVRLTSEGAVCRVRRPGIVGARKGVNFPGIELASVPTVTDKDRADAAWAADQDMDFLALSFVRRPEDLAEVRSVVAGRGKSLPVIAKIEKPQALERIQDILAASDGVMVARGDLGVEMAAEEVPFVQRRILAEARDQEKPGIVATEMLESMVESPRPTRAEVSDVTAAILDGTDAVMLSGETASGRYPVGAVAAMRRIADHADRHVIEMLRSRPATQLADADNVGEAVGRAAELIVRQLGLEAILVLDRDGRRTAAASASRPAARIVGLTTDRAAIQRMSLLWGVEPVFLDRTLGADDMAQALSRLCLDRGIAGPGAHVVVLSASSAADQGPVTILRVIEVGDS